MWTIVRPAEEKSLRLTDLSFGGTSVSLLVSGIWISAFQFPSSELVLVLIFPPDLHGRRPLHAMVPAAHSEDFVRSLSRLIFACTTPGYSTIKLFDPETGLLEDYCLNKVSGPMHGCRALPGKEQMSPQAFFDDMMKLLKGVILDDMHSSEESQCFSVSSLHQTRNLVRLRSSPALARALPRTRPSCVAMTSLDVSSLLASCPRIPMPLFKPRRTIQLQDHKDARVVSPFPPVLPDRLSWEAADEASSLLDEPCLWEADSSVYWSLDPTPVKSEFPVSRTSHHIMDLARAPACSTPRSSRPVGLGLTMFNTDGTSFDALWTLADDEDNRAPSPTDEARLRACQRRGLRRGENAPMLLGTTNGNGAQAEVASRPEQKSARFTAIPYINDDDFGFPAQTSTPLNLPPRVTPAAPARRVIGRLPVDLAKDRKPQRAQSLVKPAREPPSTIGHSGFKRASSVSTKTGARHQHCVATKRASAEAATPLADPLRFWTHWMTPVSEKDGRKTPAWKP